MKAWLVREKDEFRCTVVFAETVGKAKSIALTTDVCEDADFCNIEVRRLPQIDCYYTDGKHEMDWCNSEDRIVLVRDCDFGCECPDFDDCKVCPAKEYCGDYEILMEDLDE